MNKRLIWNFEIRYQNSLHIPEFSPAETQNARWEARFFWPEQTIIVLNGLNDSFLDLSCYEIKHRQDIYCLLPDIDYNLKIRRNQLLYKPMLEKHEQAVAYGKKLNLSEVSSSLTLPGAHENAAQLIAQIETKGQHVHVDKEALLYRFETVPTLKLELARLVVANTTWFSASIESRSRHLVESITQQMFGDNKSCDYVQFLKNIL